MKKNSFWGKLLRWLVPLGISGIALFLVLRQINFSTFIENLWQISWESILLGIGLYFISFLFRAACWFLLLRKKVSFKDVFFTMGAGYLLNNIFPFRLGEVGRAVLLSDPKGPSALEVLSSVAVERILDVLLGSFFLLLILPRVISGDFDSIFIVVAFILALGVLGILFAVARFREPINSWVLRWGEKAHFVRSWLAPKIEKFLEGLSVLDHFPLILLAFGSLFLSWMLGFGENLVIFQNLYPSPPFWWMMFVMSAAAFGAALPSVPAGLGVFEGAMVAAFTLIGVSTEAALTQALVIHAIAFVFSSIIGIVGLRLRGEAVVDLFKRVRQRKPDYNGAV